MDSSALPAEQKQKLHYRPDIDGLRAVAILAVLAFHTQYLAAGYVGVDIFFVISGFLITSLILDQKNANGFSFSGFWLRRIRRLFPAIAFFLIFTIVFAAIEFSASSLKDFSRSVIYFILLASNWHFLGESGYFSPPAQNMPLMHTWSLSIEEQFYLVFPFLLVFAVWFRSRYVKYALFGTLFLASIIFQEFLKRTGNQDAAYLNSAARFWELLAGVLCAYACRDGATGVRFGWLTGLAGIALILCSIPLQLYAGDLSGLPMLAPVAGAVLFILAGSTKISGPNKLLGLPPFAFVGRISYPLYLWHWPTIIFARYLWPAPGWHRLAVTMGFTSVMAVISYYLVEQPVRKRKILVSSRALLEFFFIFSLGFAFIGVAGNFLGDWVFHTVLNTLAGDDTAVASTEPASISLAAFLTNIDKAKDNLLPKSYDCLATSDKDLEKLKRGEICEIGPRSAGAVDLFVIGDSHIRAMFPLLQQLAENYHLRAQMAGCIANPPLPGVRPQDGREGHCDAYYPELFKYVQKLKPRHLLIIGRWTGYLEGESEFGSKSMAAVNDKKDTPMAALQKGFQDLATLLPDIDISVMSQPPEFKTPVPDRMLELARNAKSLPNALTAIDNDHDLWVSSDIQKQRTAAMKNMLVGVNQIRFIDISKIFCPDNRCIFYKDYAPLFQDSNHVTVSGANLIFDKSGDLFSFLAN